VLDVVRKLAEQRGSSLGQVAIAWVLGRPAVSAVILGARTLDQLNDNPAAATGPLSEDEIRLLDEVSQPDTSDYPYGVKGPAQRSRRLGGGRF
jgi:aryl-alcohol dehydrogenase-like predicted oxidoreductase